MDSRKARANVRKHSVTFSEASTVLADPLARYMIDPDHADCEIGIGASERGRLLVVVFSESDGVVRISACVANPHERKEHEES
jgi:uncharacterized protein